MPETITKTDKMFEDIRDTLKQFNEQYENGDTNKLDTSIKIDYEYIYDMRNSETEDFDISTGMKFTRLLNDSELKKKLFDYARHSFNISLNRSLTFENMIRQLTELVADLNNEDEEYSIELEKSKDSESKLFSTQDLLFATDFLRGETVTTQKPHKESIKVLTQSTINTNIIDNKNKHRGSIIPLNKNEIEEILDLDFIVGC